MPDWAKVHTELRRPGVTLMLLWLEHKEDFPDGYSYTQFTVHYRAWKRGIDAVMRQGHKAGEKLFVDFPGHKIPIYDARTGQVAHQAELFVAALGASNFMYAEALVSQELMYWVTAHVHAFEALGGCPAIVVCDNLRSGVTRPHRYEPDVNATYSEMAAHYGVAIIPARAYKPRDKAKVEVAVLVAERWVMARLRDHHFTSLADANTAIAELVGWVNNRPFKKLAGSRRALFEQFDRPALRPLPPTPLRVRHLEAGQGQHRLPRRGPGRPPLLLGPLPPGGRGRRRPLGRPPRWRSSPVTTGSPPMCAASSPVIRPTRPTCPSPTAATPPGRRRASSRWAGHSRAGHGQAGRGGAGQPAPPRTGLSDVPGHSAPGRALRPGPPGGGLHPGPGRARLHLPLGRVHVAHRPGQKAAAGRAHPALSPSPRQPPWPPLLHLTR